MGADGKRVEADADRRFARLFEDLEAEAAGRELHERLGEYSDLVAGEAADHALVDRFAAAVGDRIAVVAAGARHAGVLRQAAPTWLRLGPATGGEVLVALAHLDEAVLPGRGHAEAGEALSFASPLREWSEARVVCSITAVSPAGGVRVAVGRLARVARDYCEVSESDRGASAVECPRGAGGRLLIPLARIATVRTMDAAL